jgi:hypothetical protein
MTNRTAIATFRFLAPNTGAGSGGSGSGGEGGSGGAGGDGGNNKDGQGGQGGSGGAAKTWEDWHKGLSDEDKGLIEAHTSGLKSALDSERTSKKDLEKQIRDLAAKAEKGSEFEKQLTETADKLSSSTKRADFYEIAHAAGVKNLKLAWITASADDLFKRDGSPDLDALKKAYPELFSSTTTTNAGAGSGAGQGGQGGDSMNDRIRSAAGRS